MTSSVLDETTRYLSEVGATDTPLAAIALRLAAQADGGNPNMLPAITRELRMTLEEICRSLPDQQSDLDLLIADLSRPVRGDSE